MTLFISILALLAAVLLVLIVLVQNSKGGGLASGFSSSNQIMGVRKTTDFLEKATWSLAGVVVVLSIISAKISDPVQRQEAKGPKVEQTQQQGVNLDPNLNLPDFTNQEEQQSAPAVPQK